MAPRTILLAAALGAAACAAGAEPKPRAEDYRSHGAAGGVAIGAEYLVRSLPSAGEMFFVRDYLVVEVAVYPARNSPVLVAHSHFTLRLNGRKQALFPQTPGIVAASLKYPDWEHRPALTASAGAGDAGVIIGRPRTAGRFPGDPRPGRERLPEAPRVPGPQNPGGIERAERQQPDAAAVSAALPEGEATSPVSGLLYFAYRGKTKAVKKVELIYAGEAGNLTLRLN